nr:hypothetical protein [Tanacetum cinerariifolium]
VEAALVVHGHYIGFRRGAEFGDADRGEGD